MPDLRVVTEAAEQFLPGGLGELFADMYATLAGGPTRADLDALRLHLACLAQEYRATPMPTPD